MEVEYEVLQAPGEDVTSQLETLASALPPAALVQNLESALADNGMTVEVEVLEVAEPEVVGTVLLDPTTTNAPPALEPNDQPDVKPTVLDAGLESSGGSGWLWGGVAVGTVLALLCAAVLVLKPRLAAHPKRMPTLSNIEAPDPLDQLEVVASPVDVVVEA